jgi:transcriptional regulator with XRE-family HTH domain
MRLKNVSQAEIAAHTGISKPTISNFLQEKSDVGSEYLDEILRYLGIDLLKLINESIVKGFKGSKKSRNGIINDVELLLNSIDKTPRNAVLNSLLKVSSRLLTEEELQARENIREFIKGRM